MVTVEAFVGNTFPEVPLSGATPVVGGVLEALDQGDGRQRHGRGLLRRAGLITVNDFARDMADTINTVTLSPGRRIRSAEEMSRLAMARGQNSRNPQNSGGFEGLRG